MRLAGSKSGRVNQRGSFLLDRATYNVPLMSNPPQIAALQQAVAAHKGNLASIQAAALGSPYDELAGQAATDVLNDHLKAIFQNKANAAARTRGRGAKAGSASP